jgi:Shikimate 5-dehydrogenase
MKKYLVIGNPIEHSLSPKLHNHWIQKNNIDGVYEKKQIKESDIREIILEVKNDRINGINVTVPFKKSVIPFLDELTPLANEAQSVNTIYKQNNKVIGHNTDVGGFELALRHINYDVKNKKVFILGAGGVVPSIILALKKMNVEKII